MEEKVLNEIVTPYDLQSIVMLSKKKLHKIVLLTSIYAVLLVLSVLAIVFYGSYLLVFLGSVILACASAFLYIKQIKNFAFSDYSSARGEIADVHKEIKIIRTTKVGGINPFGVRKYDHDGKNEIRLGVFIKTGEQVRGYFFNDGTEEHAKYYESKGQAIHIWGTHFPVKLEIGKEKWLCPVCGKFNANKENTCARCKRKILK